VQIFSPGQVPASNLRPDDTVEVRLLQSYAHPGGVMLYRITWRDQAVVYATDTEGYVSGDRRLIAFAKDADLLIHDAQYTHEHYCGEVPGLPATQGWGHSTTQIACELAAAAGVHQLALFHHDPGYDDDRIAANETLAKALFPKSLAAREGLKLEVGHVIEYPNATSSVQYRYRKSSGQSPTTPFVTGST
jgi:ribonuclease BN (tRNA processing enzyme)